MNPLINHPIVHYLEKLPINNQQEAGREDFQELVLSQIVELVDVDVAGIVGITCIFIVVCGCLSQLKLDRPRDTHKMIRKPEVKRPKIIFLFVILKY